MEGVYARAVSLKEDVHALSRTYGDGVYLHRVLYGQAVAVRHEELVGMDMHVVRLRPGVNEPYLHPLALPDRDGLGEREGPSVDYESIVHGLVFVVGHRIPVSFFRLLSRMLMGPAGMLGHHAVLLVTGHLHARVHMYVPRRPLVEYHRVFPVERIFLLRRLHDERPVHAHVHVVRGVDVTVMERRAGVYGYEFVGVRLAFLDRLLSQVGHAVHFRGLLLSVDVQGMLVVSVVFKDNPYPVSFLHPDGRARNLAVEAPSLNGLSGINLELDVLDGEAEDLYRLSALFHYPGLKLGHAVFPSNHNVVAARRLHPD